MQKRLESWKAGKLNACYRRRCSGTDQTISVALPLPGTFDNSLVEIARMTVDVIPASGIVDSEILVVNVACMSWPNVLSFRLYRGAGGTIVHLNI